MIINEVYWVVNGVKARTPNCSPIKCSKVGLALVVTPNSPDIGRKYKCEVKIADLDRPERGEASFYSPLMLMDSVNQYTLFTRTYTFNVKGRYDIVWAVVYDENGTTIIQEDPVLESGNCGQITIANDENCTVEWIMNNWLYIGIAVVILILIITLYLRK